MLLVVDVGNTNFTFGVFDGDKLRATFRVTTKLQRTSDEYGICIRDLLAHNGISYETIKDVIIASVVPNVMHSLLSAFIKYFGIHPVVVESGIKTGIRIATENPKQIGADRIVDAAAAYELYGGPVFVIDFGTGTTYDLVDETGAFVSGVTAPGIRTSAKVYGQIGQTEYIIKQTKKETGYKNLKVVATGGLGTIIASETDTIDIYDPTLTLQGLRLIYNKQNREK